MRVGPLLLLLILAAVAPARGRTRAPGLPSLGREVRRAPRARPVLPPLVGRIELAPRMDRRFLRVEVGIIHQTPVLPDGSFRFESPEVLENLVCRDQPLTASLWRGDRKLWETIYFPGDRQIRLSAQTTAKALAQNPLVFTFSREAWNRLDELPSVQALGDWLYRRIPEVPGFWDRVREKTGQLGQEYQERVTAVLAEVQARARAPRQVPFTLRPLPFPLPPGGPGPEVLGPALANLSPQDFRNFLDDEHREPGLALEVPAGTMLASWFRLAHGLGGRPGELGFLFARSLRRRLATRARSPHPTPQDNALAEALLEVLGGYSGRITARGMKDQEAFAYFEKAYLGRLQEVYGRRRLITPRELLTWVFEEGAWRLESLQLRRPAW